MKEKEKIMDKIPDETVGREAIRKYLELPDDPTSRISKAQWQALENTYIQLEESAKKREDRKKRLNIK